MKKEIETAIKNKIREATVLNIQLWHVEFNMVQSGDLSFEDFYLYQAIWGAEQIALLHLAQKGKTRTARSGEFVAIQYTKDVNKKVMAQARIWVAELLDTTKEKVTKRYTQIKEKINTYQKKHNINQK